MKSHFETLSSYIPIDLTVPANFFLACAVVLGFVVFRYFLMVLPFVYVFYIKKPKWARKRQIYPELPSKKEQFFEIKWSLVSSLVFAFFGAGLGWIWQKGWTQIYLEFDKYGYWYLPVSWFLLTVIHDAYFYWTHRWLHLPWVYRKFHSIHHASIRPSPWGSFSFHPVESIINAAAIPLIVLFLPVHPVIILMHLTYMTIGAITNHMGFEVMPKISARHWCLKWYIGGVHHTQHHRYFKYNYGLFFTYWDVWMKTEHANYLSEFDQVFASDYLMKEPTK